MNGLISKITRFSFGICFFIAGSYSSSVAAVETTQQYPVVANTVLVGKHLDFQGKSIAIVENTETGEQDVFSLGMKNNGKGTLTEVSEERLLVVANGVIKVIPNKKGLKIGAASENSEVAEAESYSVSDKAVAEDTYASSTVSMLETRPGAIEVALDKDLVKKSWTAIPGMIFDSEIEQVDRDGAVVGYKVGNVVAESLLADVGLQSNDIVKLVNDAPLTSPLQAVKAIYSDDTSENGLRLLVERDGAEQTVLVKFAKAQ